MDESRYLFEQLQTKSASSVADQPMVTVEDWQIHHCACMELRLTGIRLPTHRFRITTAIVHFELSIRRLVTESGRVYELQGPPAVDPRLRMFALAYLESVGESVIRDYSEVVWQSIKRMTH